MIRQPAPRQIVYVHQSALKENALRFLKLEQLNRSLKSRQYVCGDRSYL